MQRDFSCFVLKTKNMAANLLWAQKILIYGDILNDFNVDSLDVDGNIMLEGSNSKIKWTNSYNRTKMLFGPVVGVNNFHGLGLPDANTFLLNLLRFNLYQFKGATSATSEATTARFSYVNFGYMRIDGTADATVSGTGALNVVGGLACPKTIHTKSLVTDLLDVPSGTTYDMLFDSTTSQPTKLLVSNPDLATFIRCPNSTTLTFQWSMTVYNNMTTQNVTVLPPPDKLYQPDYTVLPGQRIKFVYSQIYGYFLK